jgi:hypothetical protein
MAQENDVVLIYFEDKPLSFARIEDIRPDYKPDWYHVKLLMLQIPPRPVTWILRNAYINGTEFTMNGKRIRLELVECPEDELEDEALPKEKTPDSGESRVISFESLRKKK